MRINNTCLMKKITLPKVTELGLLVFCYLRIKLVLFILEKRLFLLSKASPALRKQ